MTVYLGASRMNAAGASRDVTGLVGSGRASNLWNMVVKKRKN
jgi:hypothetical protein